MEPRTLCCDRSLGAARALLLAALVGLTVGLLGPGSTSSAAAAEGSPTGISTRASGSAASSWEASQGIALAAQAAAAEPAPRFRMTTRPTFERHGAGIRVSSGPGRGAITIRLRSTGGAAVSQAAATFVSAPFTWSADGAPAPPLAIDLAGEVTMARNAQRDASNALAGVVGSSVVIGIVDAASGSVLYQFADAPTYLVCSRAGAKTVVRRGDITPIGAVLPRTTAWLADHGLAAPDESARTVEPGFCPAPIWTRSYPGGSYSGLQTGATYRIVVSLLVIVQVRRAGDVASIDASLTVASWE